MMVITYSSEDEIDYSRENSLGETKNFKKQENNDPKYLQCVSGLNHLSYPKVFFLP